MNAASPPTPADTGASVIASILERQRPARIPYAPNLWQWFTHQRNHGLLPREVAHCQDRLALFRHLGLDVFSRNLYCDAQRDWFGGLTEAVWQQTDCRETERFEGRDRVIERTYHTPAGALTERQRYVFTESTLVQEKFLIEEDLAGLGALKALLADRRWKFQPARYAAWKDRVGSDGLVIAGELFSPLKMLHFVAGPVNTTYLLADEPEQAAELLALHEAAMLELVRQMAGAGVRVMMAMDNLDVQFHPPPYVERYSASFYEKASRICHEHGSLFFIHACGQQRANLPLIASYGVDGLEGVPSAPFGDVELDEAMRLSGERLILTGGVSAAEVGRLHTRAEVGAYVKDLFARINPHAHRFILSAACAEPYTMPWTTLVHFRDAWREHGGL